MTQENLKSYKGLSFGMLFFAAIMLAVGLPLRIFQQLRLVEANGFWRRAEATQILLYVLIAALVLVPACCAYFARRKAAMDLTRRRRVPEGIAALLAACAMAADAVNVGRLAAEMLRTLALNAGGDQSQTVFRSGAAAACAEAVCAAGGALLFSTLAMADFFPKKKIFLNRLLLLAPVIWAASGMLRRFARTINYLRVSDLFLGIITLAALTLFFLYFAQLFGGISDEGRAARLLGMGIPAAVLCLLCFVPRIVAAFNGVALSQDATLDLWALALPVFIFITIAGRFLSAVPQVLSAVPQPHETAAEIAQEQQEQEDM